MNKDYLWEKLGSTVQEGLLDSNILEVMLNPDGKLWFSHRDHGNEFAGTMPSHLASSFVHALAHYENQFLNHRTPYLDAILPFQSERINVTVPPITEGIAFNIRKKAQQVFSLNHYVKTEVLTPKQADLLRQAIIDRKNILISGGPASGKTTFANALLDTIALTAAPGHRVVLLEQVPELLCPVENVKCFQVSEHVSMNTLLWLCMRNSPDRIMVGEVRDGSAFDLLKAWNTGCPGGVATIYANSARAALQRVLDLSNEVVMNTPYVLAGEAIDIVVHLEARATHPAKRVVTEILHVKKFDSSICQFDCSMFA